MDDNFEIREFRNEDLPALSVHWKESAKGWPPGFESGNDLSPEGIRQWLLRTKSIATWLGWIDDRIVAYLSYFTRSEDRDASYVGTFNAHPDFHGQSYGRRIMTHALDRAIKDRVRRVDLHTWAANEKAVPLYKKTGFFWRPRTSGVQMYNFLPQVLQNPIVKEFIGEAYWYDCLRQDLSIKPNDELYNGCSYHKYVFEKAGKNLEVLVDPSTSGITGIKTAEYEIRCDVPGLTHVAGFPQPVKWYFNSFTGKQIRMKIDCTGSEGLDYEFHESFETTSERVFVTTVKPASDLRPGEIDWYGKPLECKVEIDGQVFDVKPGIRVVRPLSVGTFPSPVYLEPGESGKFVLNIASRVQSDVFYTPEFRLSGAIEIVDGKNPGPIKILPEGSAGISLTIRSTGGSGLYRIEVAGKLMTNGVEADFFPLSINAGVVPKGQPVAIPDDDPDVTHVSNGLVSLKAKRRGGMVNVCLFESSQEIMAIYNEELGEPFSQEFSALKYDVSVAEGIGYLDVVFRIESRDFPGMKIQRTIRMDSSAVLKKTIRVINGGGQVFTGLIRALNRVWSSWETWIPMKDRIYHGPTEGWFGGHQPVPDDPSVYPEPWIAFIVPGLTYGQLNTAGMTYEGISGLKWGSWGFMNLENSIECLEPGAEITFPTVNIIAKTSHWRDIQAIALNGELSKLPVVPSHFVRVESPLFADTDHPVFKFHVMRKYASDGKVSIRLPDGRSSENSADECAYDRPIEVATPDISKIQPGIIPVEYTSGVSGREWSGRLPLMVPVKNSSVKIISGREGEYDFYRVDNGSITFDVSPKFSGSLVRLMENSDPGKNLLNTSFPEPGMWTWFNPWFGGIWPNIWFDFDFARCGFEGDTVKLNWEGHDWEGVRVTVTPLKQWQNLKYEVLYLTRPGYPVVLNLLRFTETDGCSRELSYECIAFPSPSGDPKKPSVGTADYGSGPVKLSSGKGGNAMGGKYWSAETVPESGKTLGVVTNRAWVTMWDAAENGKALWITSNVKTIPGVTVELALMFMVTDDASVVSVVSGAFKEMGAAVAKSDPEPI